MSLEYYVVVCDGKLLCGILHVCVAHGLASLLLPESNIAESSDVMGATDLGSCPLWYLLHHDSCGYDSLLILGSLCNIHNLQY